jgi:hypothetical protein
MDAKEYDRIADLLMQIRKKYRNLDITRNYEDHLREEAMRYIDILLGTNDHFANLDNKGLL